MAMLSFQEELEIMMNNTLSQSYVGKSIASSLERAEPKEMDSLRQHDITDQILIEC